MSMVSDVFEVFIDLQFDCVCIIVDIVQGFFIWLCQLLFKYFYDVCGLVLFEQIICQFEYYLICIELKLLQDCVYDIVKVVGLCLYVVELGSGSGCKIELLLYVFIDLVVYILIEILCVVLLVSIMWFVQVLLDIEMLLVCVDFICLVQVLVLQCLLVCWLLFFFGFMLGNFVYVDVVVLLWVMCQIMGVDGLVLIGIDLYKDLVLIELVYNDVVGVIVDFIFNLLCWFNCEIGSDFDFDGFCYWVCYSVLCLCIEIELVSICVQIVYVGGCVFDFVDGEVMMVEYSYKYIDVLFVLLVVEVGLCVSVVWNVFELVFGL